MDNAGNRDIPTRPFKTDLSQASNVGLVRTLNEDSLFTLELFLNDNSKGKFAGLYAVADGIGGHEGGEIASSLAIRSLSASLISALLLPAPDGDSSLSTEESVSNLLTTGVKAANSEIFAQGQAQSNDMGTTLTAALVIGNMAYIINVGDSRVYLLEGDRIRQVTRDHSLVAELVESGLITPEDIYTHPKRNIITRCLGTQKDIEADLFIEELRPGRALLLCSDGLWEMVRDDAIKDIVLKAENAQIACERLTELANINGGVDNISVIVINMTN
ncbi:Stp1/IreP family PP2C-type Ser/Thr phosphatase [Chloroflexota bacterium]